METFVIEIRRRFPGLPGELKKMQPAYLNKIGLYNFKPVINNNKIIYFEQILEEDEARLLKKKCKKKGYEVFMYNAKYRRGRGVRRKFLKDNPGPIYRCVYCGKKIRTDNMEVDHLIPVSKIKKSKFWQRKLKKLGCESINDPNNLVPACFRCNRKKGNKLGIWYYIGQLGRKPYFWMIRNLSVTLLILFVFFSVLFAIKNDTVFWQTIHYCLNSFNG